MAREVRLVVDKGWTATALRHGDAIEMTVAFEGQTVIFEGSFKGLRDLIQNEARVLQDVAPESVEDASD